MNNKKVKQSKSKKSAVETKVGYKVVRKVGNELLSASVKGLRIRFVSDKFVGPRTWGGPITLFDSPYSAVGFIEKLNDKENMRVYRANYIPTIVDKVWRFMDGSLDVKNLSELPEHTVLARKVKITKRIF